MSPFAISTIILLTLFSCKQKQQGSSVIKPDYLSEWFIANEDSLYNEFVNYVAENSLCRNCDTSWGAMAYQKVDSNSYMGRLSLEAKKYSDGLEVTYFYDKSTNPKCRVLLSTGYNSRLTSAIDSIFSYPFTPKHFTVEKYEQPDKGVDIYRVNNTNAVVKELRIKINPVDTLNDLVVYVHSKTKDTTINTDTKDFFVRQLFGEEILLKKINKVTIQFGDSIQSNWLTLDEAVLKLKP